MYYYYSGGELAELEGFRNSGITATDDSHRLLPEEGGITGGTVGDPPAGKLGLPGYTQFLPLRAAGYNHGPGREVAVRGFYQLLLPGYFNTGNLGGYGLQSEPGCLLVHKTGQIKAANALRKTRVVLHLLRVYYLPADRPPLNEQAA